MSSWKRYQRACRRKRFQGTIIPRATTVGRGCERRGCGGKVVKSIYTLGYLAGVCQEHYEVATSDERQNAIRFKYAER